nr:hypothetical protein BaRGS_023952 [Batillaria attramentaria]
MARMEESFLYRPLELADDSQIKAGVRFLGSFFSPAEGFYLPSTLKPTIFHDIDVMERKWLETKGSPA